MNRLEVAREAVVFGGNTEGTDMLDPLRRALCEGKNAIFDSVLDVSPNVADLIADPEKLKKMIKGKTVYMRSLSCVAVDDNFAEWRQDIQGMILDAPVEPLGVPKTFGRGIKLFLDPENKATAEDKKFVPGLLQAPKEFMRHPIVNAQNPFLAASFSTIGAITMAPEGSFNGGLGYFERKYDQFRYNLVHGEGGAVRIMRAQSYDAATFGGNHMGGAYRPEDTAAQLKAYLETRS